MGQALHSAEISYMLNTPHRVRTWLRLICACVHSIVNSSSSAKLLEAPTLIAMIFNFFHYPDSAHSVECSVNVWMTKWQGNIRQGGRIVDIL